MSTLRQTEAKFAEMAAKSRKHPAYWKALAELKHGEVLHERNRMRRFLRGVLKEIKKERAEWVALDRDEIEQALGLPTREDG